MNLDFGPPKLVAADARKAAFKAAFVMNYLNQVYAGDG
jgi:hypothetical protein